jgi:hypothetical protein
VRWPQSAALVWDDAYVPFTGYDSYRSDSLLEIIGLTDLAGVKGPQYDAVPPLQRVALAGVRRIFAEIEGGDTWHNRISSAAKRAAYVDIWRRGMLGTVSNRIRIQMGRNDKADNTYLLQTAFQADLVSGNA